MAQAGVYGVDIDSVCTCDSSGDTWDAFISAGCTLRHIRTPSVPVMLTLRKHRVGNGTASYIRHRLKAVTLAK